jgi:flagellar biosynthetic protein FlhB
MSEERTQAPSRQRRRQAREHGLVAHSVELTAAVGLLAAVLLWTALGASMVEALGSLIREPLISAPILTADPANVAAHVQSAAARVVLPVGIIIGGIFVAAIVAHQLQVRGLWVPSLLAPDLSRLGGAWGSAARFGRGAWQTLKVCAVAAVSLGLLRSEAMAIARLAEMDTPELAASIGLFLTRLLARIAAALVVLGLVDFTLHWLRTEARLRLTPDEHREELRALDGDPVIQARRRRLAQSRRRSPARSPK